MDFERVILSIIAPGATYRNGSNSWGTLCNLLHEVRIKTPGEFEVAMRVLEALYKKATGGRKMPMKWKTNKSVLEAAIRNQKPFVDSDGTPLSKGRVSGERGRSARRQTI